MGLFLDTASLVVCLKHAPRVRGVGRCCVVAVMGANALLRIFASKFLREISFLWCVCVLGVSVNCAPASLEGDVSCPLFSLGLFE